ncbi:MAG: sporulation protein YqfD [Clostridia bacterium]|nr:sporulation protein YqfD [Clostridia bacterium]
MLHPLLFWVGYQRLRVDRSYAGEIMNLCRAGGFVYRDFSFRGDYAEFLCTGRHARRIREACRDRGIPVVVAADCGLPALLRRYRRRYGIFVGALLFCGILFISGKVVWRIQVDGNRSVSDAAVIQELERCGMSVGDRIGALDTAIIENRVLIASDEISWISINLIGTVARVEIRETIPYEETESYSAANLVAARSGTVELFEDVRGNIAVKIGDTVAEGELLVGGLYQNPTGGFRYTCARGRVLARTQRSFEIEIPLRYEKKAYTGQVAVEKYLIFFKKEVKFFGNTGNSYGSCDTIDTVEYWELPGGVTLPIGIRTVRHRAYETVEAERSTESAMELAYERLRWQMEGEVPDGRLVRKELTSELTDSAFLLRCTAEYIEDIAKTQKIEIEGIP